MVYRVSSLTYLLGKPRVKVPHFAMVNLIAGEQVVPELVQHDFTAANVAAKLREILLEGAARDRMLEGLTRVKGKLNPPPKRERRRNAAGSGRPAPQRSFSTWPLDLARHGPWQKLDDAGLNLVLTASFSGESSS